MKKRSALVPVLILGGALAACDPPKEAQHEAPARPVLVAEAHYQPRERSEALPGVLKARTESDLGFRVGGRLEKRLVDAGALVHKGDALAQLDATDFKLQLDQAEADLAAARASLAQASAEESRQTTLKEKGWAAGSDFDRTHAAADQARATARRAERAVTLAQNALAYATLTADADGVVSATSAEPGQVVAAGAPVVRLAHEDALEAAVAVPEALVERVKAQKASVEFWALKGAGAEAKLRELSPNADSATRTYAARFSLASAPPAARLGMSVTVSLSDGAIPVARLPLGAVFTGAQGQSVWTVDRASGALSETPVSIAATDADFAYVASGVPEGAAVVTLGVHKLDAHEKVRVVENFAGL